MEELLFHPKVVHLPIALALLMPALAGGIALAWRIDWLPRRAWWIAVVLQAALVGSSLVAMETGEHEEDRVERVVAERHIEEHEEAAEAFLWAAGVALAAMLVTGVIPQRGPALASAAAATLLSVVVLALGFRAGQAGGELVYKHGAASAYTDTAPPSRARGHDDHDDHDEDDD